MAPKTRRNPAPRVRLASQAGFRPPRLAPEVAGTVLGSAIGAPLSLYALAHAPVGVAATLLFMTPVFLLPLSRIFMGEPITARSVLGTLLTVAGAAGLFLLP